MMQGYVDGRLMDGLKRREDAELRAGRLLPPVDRVFPLADGRLAFEHLSRGEQFGKVVVSIS